MTGIAAPSCAAKRDVVSHRPVSNEAVCACLTSDVGGVAGRGASGLNIVNPAFDAFWHDPKTRANIHLVWSPLAARSGAEGWQTHHQIALFVDRALYVKLFRPRKE